MSAQLWAVAVVGVIVLIAAGLESFRAWHARRAALAGDVSGRTADLPTGGEEPYIVYFTGESCTVCKTHQEPALSRLGEVRVDRVDAVADRALADRFHVYTLPTTVVMAGDGRPLHVNYGYAPASKLERQLGEARARSLRTATA